jgi:hypothetical protein
VAGKGEQMRRIGVPERRARLGLRHHLAPRARAGTVTDLARGLVALHSTDPASVYLSAWARLRAPDHAAIDRALYEDRSLVRILGMRRTMFVLPVETAAIVQAACTRAIAARERARLIRFMRDSGIADDVPAWLGDVEESTLRALRARGEATAAELSVAEPRLREQIRVGVGTNNEGSFGMSTRVLFLLAADGRIVRGRPKGSWISTLYRWSPIEAWLPGGLPDWPIEQAQVELARRWLAAFGPGTVADLKWWTGWTVGQVKKALAQLDVTEVDLDGQTGLVLAEDVEPVPAGRPFAALLPALDPTIMGWTGRDWFLGEHAKALFDRSGNVGPTIWWDGRIVGGWAQRKDGEIAYRLLEDVGTTAVSAVEKVAASLGSWLGSARVTPRFRTPLERELSS